MFDLTGWGISCCVFAQDKMRCAHIDKNGVANCAEHHVNTIKKNDLSALERGMRQ